MPLFEQNVDVSPGFGDVVLQSNQPIENHDYIRSQAKYRKQESQ